MLTLSSKPKIWWFHVVVLSSAAEKCTEIRAARAARKQHVYFSFFNQSYSGFLALP